MHSRLRHTFAAAGLGLLLISIPASAFAGRSCSRHGRGFGYRLSGDYFGLGYSHDRCDDNFAGYGRTRFDFSHRPDLIVRRAYARFDWDAKGCAYRRVVRVLIENRGDRDAGRTITAIRFSPEYGRRSDVIRIATPSLRPGEAVWISDLDGAWHSDGHERGRFIVEVDDRHDLREYDERNNGYGPVEYSCGAE
jgi:hypothetical protein